MEIHLDFTSRPRFAFVMLRPDRPWNVLVFPAASEVGLEIHRSLRDCKEVVLHGAMQPGPSAADFYYRRLHTIPSIHDPACLAQLQALIQQERIDAIFPAYDDVLLWLSHHAAAMPATIIGAPAASVALCRAKSRTYAALAGLVPVPRQWAADDPALIFPVFVKPDCGQGSQRARRIDDRAALRQALAAEPDLLVLDNLPGEEYTVDCFSQRGKGVLFAAARARLQTRTGIATRTQPAALPEVRPLADRIADKLGLHGAWFFQLKRDAAGALTLLEVAPRIAGSMALSRAGGPNFALLSLYEAAGFDLTIDAFDHGMVLGRSLDTRFLYDKPLGALYIDLDDTLILCGAVNTRLVALIFQCRNRGVPVHLITRHRGDLAAMLAQHRLQHLFDRVIHLPTDLNVTKGAQITEPDAVLVDDSFAERHVATRDYGLRCFDAAGALCLLDERA